MIKFRQFRPPGVYLKDIKKYTGYVDVKGACVKAGVTLWRLNNKEYAPLSLQQTYKILRVIRMLQGERFLRSVNRLSLIHI